MPKFTIDEEYPAAIVISGPELVTLSEAQWDQLARYQEIVFSRTTPEQKLRIVRELQSRAEVVAMTGDGVNDAPSLRAADVGIALGSGCDIAIEAADMVLLDSFSSVVEALRFGRMMCVREPTAISQLQSVDYYSRALRPFPTNRVTITPYSRL